MIFNYSGAVGLLGALKSKSLKEEHLNKVKDKDIKTCTEILKFYLPENKLPSTLLELEHSLNLGYIKRITKLLRFLKGKAFLALKSLLFEYEIFNLKLLMRSIYYNLSLEEVKSIFYFGIPFLIFKRFPSQISTYKDIEHFLKKTQFLKEIFEEAFKAFQHYKDIFFFEVHLDIRFLRFLKEVANFLRDKGSFILENYVDFMSLIWALRFKFFQNRDKAQIYKFFSQILNEKILSKILEVVNLDEALNLIEENFKEKIFESSDFERDLKEYFFSNFLKKRELNLFCSVPFLMYALKQKYFLERLIFILNSKQS